MGASGSKECQTEQSSAPNSTARRSKRFRGSVFGSSCIRLACRSGDSADPVQVSHRRNEEQDRSAQSLDQKQKGTESYHENTQIFKKVEAEQPYGFDVEEWAETSDAQNQSPNHSRNLLSRFSLFPSSFSFRKGRAIGAASSRDNSASTNFILLGSEEEIQGRHESEPGSYTRDAVRNGGPRYDDLSVPALTSHVDIDSIPPQITERRTGNREPIERNVRFSRSLSVGRLRERVLRQSSASDSTVLPSRPDEVVMNASNASVPHDAESSSPTHANSNITSPALPVSSRPNTHRNMASGLHHEAELSLPRETRYQDGLEHRSNFLERRRRIRSQVRALERLGNRFENLSGHERSCIMSGHHRTGCCSCRVGIRVGNSNVESNASGSISRIVMLAEALFEVLDEMHQQSVALSSQPSISSLGSVPAPSEAVESLPVKLHSKVQTHHSDDIAQCYVCLLEYEEGDKIRVLPCHHEFHKTCIDKWLKEIHRVCPLCRGDICRVGTSHLESQS